jgi:hypothetical protein
VTSRTVVFNTAISQFSQYGAIQLDAIGAGAVAAISQTDNTTQMRATYEYLGYSTGGHGAYAYTAGNHAIINSLYVGYGTSSTGQFTLGGTGSLSVGGSTKIGDGGAGTFTHNGGTHAVVGSLKLGESSGASGRYELSAGRVSSESTYVGAGGDATFTQTGGTHAITNWLFVGQSPSGGRYNLDGGTLTTSASNLSVGTSGPGSFVQTGGSASFGGNFYAGSNGGVGYLNLSAAASFFVNGQERIGYQGGGTVTQTGGTHTATSIVHVGSSAGSNGRYLLSGGLYTVRGNLTVGDAGTGVFEHSGGSLSAESEMYVATTFGAVGRYTLGGTGSLNVRSNQYVGSGGTGTFTQTGGTNTVGGILHVGGGNTGTYAMSGGTMAPKRLWVRGQGLLTMSGGTVNAGEGVDVDGSADFAGGSSTINATTRGILDFGHAAAFTNTTGLTINGSPQTLVIFPGGFDPQTQLAAYNNPDGVTGFAGSTVVVPAGKAITGSARVSDFVQVDGSLSRASFLALSGGAAIGGSGAVTLDEFTTDNRTSTLADNGKLTSANYVIVGDVANGTLVQSGGALSAINFIVGFQNTFSGQRGRGHYTLSGGTINASSETVGSAGDGTFVQTGGTHTASVGLTIASSAGSTGTFTLAGGTLNVGKFVNKGAFVQTGGTFTPGSIELSDAGRMTLAPGAGATVKVGLLSVKGQAKLDVGDNALVVGSPIGSATGGTYNGVSGLVQAGYHGGDWAGDSGVVTTMPAAASAMTSIGDATAGDTG